MGRTVYKELPTNDFQNYPGLRLLEIKMKGDKKKFSKNSRRKFIKNTNLKYMLSQIMDNEKQFERNDFLWGINYSLLLMI